MPPIPTDPSVRAVIDQQVQVMFRLADEALADLTLDECLWQIDPRSWTVHRRDGRWFGEIGDEYPDLPTPSLAWTMWHPIWWLRTLLAHTKGEPAPAPEMVEWPGPDAALSLLRELWAEWSEFVAALDADELESSALTTFPYTDERPFVYVVGWASMELTKNISEMCVLRGIHRDLACTMQG